MQVRALPGPLEYSLVRDVRGVLRVVVGRSSGRSCPSLVRLRITEHLVEPFGDRVLLGGEQVAVEVHGDRDRAVPEVTLDVLGVRPGGDHQSGTGVAQIVDSQVGGQTRSLEGGSPDLLGEVRVPEWSPGSDRLGLVGTAGRGEDQGVRVWPDVLGEMAVEHVSEVAGEGDESRPVTLGRPEDQFSADLGDGLGDLDSGPQDVDATSPECSRLTPAKPSVSQDVDQGPVGLGHGPSQVVELDGGEEALLRAGGARQAGAGGRVGGEVSVLHRRLEDGAEHLVGLAGP
ncbi:MAG: hypothetical protein R6X29_03930 [Acidimicrobiia bacterium]